MVHVQAVVDRIFLIAVAVGRKNPVVTLRFQRMVFNFAQREKNKALRAGGESPEFYLSLRRSFFERTVIEL